MTKQADIPVLLVEDDPGMSDMIATCLRADHYAVTTAGTGHEALAAAERAEPEIVISDVLMPEMDGFQFLTAYRAKFPHRLTPFIFLSSLSDRYSMVLGLDLGADDYLTKPVHLDVLKAKVRSILQTKTRYTSPTFYGDLSRYSFIRVLQFCERSALNGEIVITNPRVHTRLQFRGGIPSVPGSENGVDFLAKLCDQKEGTFVIHAQAVDFTEIESVASTTPPPPPTPSPTPVTPMGRLSAVRADQRVFQIQTEFAAHPREQIVTTVTVNGRTVQSREGPLQHGADPWTIQSVIETQHAAVEAEVREKLSGETIRRMRDQEFVKLNVEHLFEAGCERFLGKDYSGAHDMWEEALGLSPDDRTVQMCLAIARRKIDEI